MMNETEIKEIKTKAAIIGGGPAGCAAAIQLKRSGIDPILFEQNSIGGLAINANQIENYLGFPDGIDGLEFIELLENHIDAFAVEVFFEQIKKIEYEDDKFILHSDKKRCICDFLIVATGTTPNIPDIKGMDALLESNLLAYEVSEIPEEKASNSNIAILGGGDAAFDYALNLEKKQNNVAIIHRSTVFKCLPLLYDRVMQLDAIQIMDPGNVVELQEEEDEVKVILEDMSVIEAEFVLIAYGRKPEDELVSMIPEETINNQAFLIGDLVNKQYRQISIATRDGLKAAMKIIELMHKV
ncbi:MAG: NAD(P)/FAD-dependent oxidoreductase [Candidatus Heimdallarchaeota archaeon]